MYEKEYVTESVYECVEECLCEAGHPSESGRVKLSKSWSVRERERQLGERGRDLKRADSGRN